MTPPSNDAPGFGPDNKPLSELTDAELLEEVQRRRRARGLHTPLADGPSKLSDHQAAQYFANLELHPSAGAKEVEAAYERLKQRFAPAADSSDPERRRAAGQLLRSLREAYTGLLKHLSPSAE